MAEEHRREVIKVSAVIPTRGDVDMQAVLDTLPFDDVVVWDNSLGVEDLKVYGRYEAIVDAKHDVIYTQDDDCTLTPGAIASLVEAYAEGDIVCNMPVSRWADYPDSCLVGWGSVFHRSLPDWAFEKYLARRANRNVDEFRKTCDVVFTTLTPHRKLDLGFSHLPWAETPGRMFKQPDHQPIRSRVLEQARRVRDDQA